jgi:hypothetical protein
MSLKMQTLVLVLGCALALALLPAQAQTPGTFAAASNLNSPRYDHTATATLLNNGSVLVTGGFDSAYLSTAEVYNPLTGAFDVVGNMNVARQYQTATLLNNGMVLIAGGYNGSPTGSAELFNPSTGTFSVTGTMHTARYNHTATLLVLLCYKHQRRLTQQTGQQGSRWRRYLASWIRIVAME